MQNQKKKPSQNTEQVIEEFFAQTSKKPSKTHRQKGKKSSAQTKKKMPTPPVGEKKQATLPTPTPETKQVSPSAQSPETKKKKGKKGTPKAQPTPQATSEVKKNPLPSSFKKKGAKRGSMMKEATPMTTQEERTPKKGQKGKRGTLRVMSLGGLHEIGKNMTVIEYGEDIVVIDCGLAFPDEEMPGVDLVIPDISYLVQNAHRVRGILITHGHEDHVGAVAYVLAQINVPIYGTRLSLGIIEGKLDENPPKNAPELYTVEAGDTISLGKFKAEFIHVNHSIADACAIALHTPLGTVFHTGDFKLDVSPLDGNVMDLARIAEIGKKGTLLLLCESTNAERSGFTPSERTVGSSLERLFMQYNDRRIIIATFSSNVHRVQQIIDASYRHGRKVAVLGRSMVNIIGAASELGYMEFPEGVLVDVSDLKKYRPEEITLITTGSQGEPMSALYRIAFAEHKEIKLDSRDVVVLSSGTIPGNEKFVGKIVNALIKSGVKVVNDSSEEVHVSGHACREEIKLMMALLKPKYLMPIHGEIRHLYANKEIGEFMGIPSSNIFISEIGKVLEVDDKGARFAGTVPSGKVLVDGSGVGDIGAVVLRDRKHLSEDGLVVVVATIDMGYGMIVSGPDIVSRGFVYVKESEDLMREARAVATTSLEKSLSKKNADWQSIKNDIRDDLAKFIYQNTKRKPMILPVIMDI